MNNHLIDDEIQAFIKKTNGFYAEPERTTLMTTEQQRDEYNRMCAAFKPPYPSGVGSLDQYIDYDGYHLPLRYYRSKGQDTETAVVYFHGGGFILGGLESHDSVCADLCASTGISIVAVDYRLAPEYKHPQQFSDALYAFNYLATQFKHLIVCGDSAGGNLAAAVSVATQNHEVKPIGQVLIYPSLGGELLELPSYIARSNAPMLTREDVHVYMALRSDGPPPRNDPTFSPLLVERFEGLPPCYACSADIDPLRDDAQCYVERLKQAGVDANYDNEPGLVHGYLRARHSSKKARNSFLKICSAIIEMAK